VYRRANVGTLCVIDPKPGSIGQNARDKVHVLAAEVQDLLQARLEEESGSVGSGSDKERGCGSGGSEERNKRTSSHLTSAGPNLTWKPDAHTQVREVGVSVSMSSLSTAIAPILF
jgi:hypothetical protein